MSLRNRLWRYLRRNHPEGCHLTRPLLAARAVLFPIDFIRWKLSAIDGFDWHTDSWVLDGVRFSHGSILMLTRSVGQTFTATRQGDIIVFHIIEDKQP